MNPDDANFGFIILALAMVIIGGFGSWSGALLGAFLLAWLPTKLDFLGNWWPVIYGGAMILIAAYLPGGFFAVARRAVQEVRARHRRPSSAPASEDRTETKETVPV